MGETTSNPFQFKLGAQTHVGCVRTNNEDNFIVSADLASGEWLLPRSQNLFTLGAKGAVLVVADGMGGLDAGEVASRIAVDTVKTCFAADQITDEVVKDEESIRRYMRNVVVAADGNIKRRSKEEKTIQAMGTTLVVAWLIGEYAYIAWCGDSRAYLFNPVSGLKQVSKDHSYVQELVDSGRLLPEYAFDHPDSNIITRSLGNPQREAEPDFIRIPLQAGETLLLCTDGLNSMLRDEEIEAVMQETEQQIDTCVNALIQNALDRGGHDNVTVVLCQLVAAGGGGAEELQKTVSLHTEKPKNRPLRKVLGAALAVLLVLLVAAVLYWGWDGGWQRLSDWIRAVLAVDRANPAG